MILIIFELYPVSAQPRSLLTDGISRLTFVNAYKLKYELRNFCITNNSVNLNHGFHK